jgi:nicotinamidase-related amidase
MDALIVVDMQNDFCSGGALEVPDGDAVIEAINALSREADFVVATATGTRPITDRSPKTEASGPSTASATRLARSFMPTSIRAA